jgi:hydrogenase expression/formation protein HypD
MYPPLPLKLIDIRGEQGTIEAGNERYPVQLHFLDSPNIGEYVLVQMGFALQSVHSRYETGTEKPSLIEIRSEIETQLSGRDFTVLLTSGTQIANLQLNGIRYILPQNLLFAYGPTCAECITPVGYYRNVLGLAHHASVIVVTFNEIMNMPTPGGTLNSLRMAGSDVRVIHSPYDILRIAEWNPDKEIVLAAVGYDTVAAMVGITLEEALRRGLKNLSVYPSLHKHDIMVREYILLRPPSAVDGVVCSAYDVAAAGIDGYNIIVRDLHRAFASVGCTATEVLHGVLETIRQVKSNRLTLYRDSESLRLGNEKLQSAVNDTFSLSGTTLLNGKNIDRAKYILRENFHNFDAERKFDIRPDNLMTMPGCSGLDIQLGHMLPVECPNFGVDCKPAHPHGAGMTSPAGLCHMWYRSSSKFKIQHDSQII